MFKPFFIFSLIFISVVNAGWYWGNHCGREARNRNAPIQDAFDSACYQHDRCQESRTPDWLCSVQVSMAMMQASAMTGQPIPSQILSGFAAEHGRKRK
uniref:Phospholipase A2 domain-containing protein n=1 Tax=Acrobeloides nanus TaxID=290746 RepID=A0A914DDF8_9BILA